MKETQRDRKRFLGWGRLTHPIILLLSIILLVGQWGCATAPKAPPSLLSEEDRAKLGTIGVVSARFAPEVHLEAPTSGKGSGAGKGAAAGFFGSILAGAQWGRPYTEAGLLLAPGVAIVMAIAGAVEADPAETVEQAQSVIRKTIGELNVQEGLRDRVLQVARQETRRAFLLLEDKGPAVLGERVNYAVLVPEGIDAVLEVNMLEFGVPAHGINPPLPLIARACARLIRLGDGKALSDRIWIFRGRAHKFVDWASDGAQPLHQELDHAYQSLAEQIVEDFFLTVPTVMYGNTKEFPSLGNGDSWCGIRYRPIQDFTGIAGTWSGHIEFAPASERPPMMKVTMTIKDDGSYELVTTEQHAGILRLERGKIEFTVDIDSRTQHVTLTLHKRGERQSLEGSGHDGATLWEMRLVE